MCVGDIVLISDENTPRNQWRTGRDVKAYVNVDKFVRKVQLRVGTPLLNSRGKSTDSIKFLERPIHKLVLLLESED